MRLIDEILNDINQAKQKITSVELEIGHASGPSKQVNTLIQAENLLTSCYSRLSDIDPESLRPQGEWVWKHRHHGGFLRYTGADEFGNTHTITVDERHECDEPYCPNCGKWNESVFLNYCPNCGAKMKGAGENA